MPKTIYDKSKKILVSFCNMDGYAIEKLRHKLRRCLMMKWLHYVVIMGLFLWVVSAWGVMSAMSISQDISAYNDPTPPPGGRADLARELIEMEIYGPLQETFQDERFEFVFRYDVDWQIEILESQEVTARYENTVVTFSGQAFLQLNDLASFSTLEDMVDEAMWRLGDYEAGKFTVFKANGRPAVEILGYGLDGSERIFVGMTFSDGRFGLATIQTDDEFLLEDVVYIMLDSFDIAPLSVGELNQMYLARDVSYTLLYPEGWTLEDVPQGGYVAISNGEIAINVYGSAGIDLQGLSVVDGDVMGLAQSIIGLVGWQAEAPQRLRIDGRPVARLIYENPVYNTQGRIYTIVLDTETRALGYFDVVPLSASSSVAAYEHAIFDILETFKAPEF
jgi:hypothetical protein